MSHASARLKQEWGDWLDAFCFKRSAARRQFLRVCEHPLAPSRLPPDRMIELFNRDSAPANHSMYIDGQVLDPEKERGGVASGLGGIAVECVEQSEAIFIQLVVNGQFDEFEMVRSEHVSIFGGSQDGKRHVRDLISRKDER
jgi:hypothetical protein